MSDRLDEMPKIRKDAEKIRELRAELAAARAENEKLTNMIRNLCIGHDDDCGCPYCKTVFRQEGKP